MGEPKAAALSRLQNLKAILQLVPNCEIPTHPITQSGASEHVQSNLMHSPLRNLTGAQGEFIHSPQMQKHNRDMYEAQRLGASGELEQILVHVFASTYHAAFKTVVRVNGDWIN